MKGARRLCQKPCLDALTVKDNYRIIQPDLTIPTKRNLYEAGHSNLNDLLIFAAWL